MIIADYGLGTINQNIIKEICEESKKNKIKVLVSSTGFRYLQYKGLDVMIKINLKDSYSIIGADLAQKINSKTIGEKLSKILMIKEILLTKGEDGITIFDYEQNLDLIATQNKKLDVKGVGEVMIAAIATELINKNSFQDACVVGNIAAGVAVSSKDIYSIKKSDILKARETYEEWINQK